MKKFIVVTLFLVFGTASFAGVNLKNGNYYITYTDIIVPGGGHDLQIVRTYNSKATEMGWFGFGWGSDYETNLTVSADGSVVIHENGSGATTRFTPRTSVDAQAAASKIVEAMRKRTTITEKSAKDLIRKLERDAELRQAYARRFKVKAKLSAGSELYSNVRGIQRVKVTKKGYKRIYNDGKAEEFNKDGKLVRIIDKNGYHISFNYKGRELKSIKDSQAKQLFFSWYSDGKVKGIWSAGDKKANYKYEDKDLAEATNISGNTFTYKYDRNHNMISISYKDGSKKTIGYEPKTQFVSKIVERNGEATKYEYGANSKNPDFHYWTIVTKKKGPKAKAIKNRYEYEIKRRNDGSQYTYRILTVVNGVKTETIYSDKSSLPLKITRGKHVTSFEYNKKGLLVKKRSTRGDFVELNYHKKLNKITRVKNNKGWTTYSYDKKGNLSKAVSSRGKSVLLIYDRKGRITKMVDQQKKSKKRRTLSFKYNALGKPVEIAMAGIGKINVAYDNYGEIKKVESKSGHKMALQVTQAFQSLLSIVKPAGVNLNM